MRIKVVKKATLKPAAMFCPWESEGVEEPRDDRRK